MTLQTQIETCYCPTCGRLNEVARSPEWLLTHFSGLYSSILSVLIEYRRSRKGVSLRELIVRTYADFDMDPPAGSPNVVQKYIAEHSARLNELGWDIVGPKTTGTGYHLVTLDRT